MTGAWLLIMTISILGLTANEDFYCFILTSIHHEPWTILQRRLIWGACIYLNTMKGLFSFFRVQEICPTYLHLRYTKKRNRGKNKEIIFNKNSLKHKYIFMPSQILNLNSKDNTGLQLHRNFTWCFWLNRYSVCLLSKISCIQFWETYWSE